MNSLQDEPWNCSACSFQHEGEDAAAPECTMCGTACPVPRYGVPIDMTNLAFASQQIKVCDAGGCACWSMPLTSACPRTHTQYPLVAQLDKVAQVPQANAKEFCLCTTFHPRMVVEAIRNGVFPMR